MHTIVVAPGKIAAVAVASFPPIDAETRSHVTTECAAFHLLRKPQTLRAWACLENGPLQPTRVLGRLSWAVADIKRVLNGSDGLATVAVDK